jgi:hypothetical protein
VLEALIGAAVGVLTIVLARAIRGQRWLYALGLLTLPALYAMWALRVGEQALAVKELAYGIPFLIAGMLFAFRGFRHSALVVGAFWILHAVWDLTHDRFFANAGVPGWYPVFCFSVDVVIGAYLLWLSRRIPDGNLRRA